MKGKQRILFLMFSPAVIGTVLLTVQGILAMPKRAANVLSMIPATLIFAVVISLIPAAMYTALMEVWLRFSDRHWAHCRRPFWSHLITIALSTSLGAGAGVAVHLATEAPVGGVGAITGFLIGSYLARRGKASLQTGTT